MELLKNTRVTPSSFSRPTLNSRKALCGPHSFPKKGKRKVAGPSWKERGLLSSKVQVFQLGPLLGESEGRLPRTYTRSRYQLSHPLNSEIEEKSSASLPRRYSSFFYFPCSMWLSSLSPFFWMIMMTWFRKEFRKQFVVEEKVSGIKEMGGKLFSAEEFSTYTLKCGIFFYFFFQSPGIWCPSSTPKKCLLSLCSLLFYFFWRTCQHSSIMSTQTHSLP